MVFSAFNYAATFSWGKIPCPRRSVGCSDRNNHLWVIFQQRTEGSGGRSVTNKMDSIKNQFHSCYRNEQWKGKKEAIQQLLQGGGFEGKKGSFLEEILTLLWNDKMHHLKNFKFWCGFRCVYKYFHWVWCWETQSVPNLRPKPASLTSVRSSPKAGDPCSSLCACVMCAHTPVNLSRCTHVNFFPIELWYLGRTGSVIYLNSFRPSKKSSLQAMVKGAQQSPHIYQKWMSFSFGWDTCFGYKSSWLVQTWLSLGFQG